MSSVRFFDCISPNIFENYFYLDGISGKLGARKFTIFLASKNEIKEITNDKKITFKQVILTIIKLASYAFLPLLVIMAAGKLIYRSTHKFKIVTKEKIALQHLINTSLPKDRLEQDLKFEASSKFSKAQKDLSNIWENYKKPNIIRKEPLRLDMAFLKLMLEFIPGPDSTVRPDDHPLANLVLACESNPDVYFIPTSNFFGQSFDIKLLKETLGAAFAVGKKMVVARLSNKIHGVAAGFCADGTFKIIDSMRNGTVNIDKLTKDLNEAMMKDRFGKLINFAGEYVNTHVQKGGHDCLRFATLYCYQMAQTKRLDAYMEVNGAFLEGRLKTFEDYKKINGSVKIGDLSGKEYTYSPFMQSWVYRGLGIEVDSWEQMPLRLLMDAEFYAPNKQEIYCFQKDRIPLWFDSSNFIIMDDNGNEIPLVDKAALAKQEINLNENDTILLGELKPKMENEKTILVFDKDKKAPRVYRLLSNQKLIEKRLMPDRLVKNIDML
jgi:hypothetical protein